MNTEDIKARLGVLLKEYKYTKPETEKDGTNIYKLALDCISIIEALEEKANKYDSPEVQEAIECRNLKIKLAETGYQGCPNEPWTYEIGRRFGVVARFDGQTELEALRKASKHIDSVQQKEGPPPFELREGLFGRKIAICETCRERENCPSCQYLGDNHGE